MADIVEITDFSAPELDVYARLTGAQLRACPQGGLFIAEGVTVIGHALDAGYRIASLLMERRHIVGKAAGLIARCGDVPVYTADSRTLEQLTGFALTRGVLAAFYRPELPTLAQVCAGARRVAVLEGLNDPTNVGAVMRSAAALGMDAVLLTPSCCDPLHRRAVRVSMGTVFQVPWTRIGQQAQDGHGSNAFAAAGFTNDTKDLALMHFKADAAHSLHFAGGSHKGGFQILYLQNRLAHFALLTSSASGPVHHANHHRQS